MNSDRRRFAGQSLGLLASASALGACSSLAGSGTPASLLPLPPAATLNRSNEARPKPGQAWEFRSINLYNQESLGKQLERVAMVGAGGIDIDLLSDKTTLRERYVQPWKILQEAHHDATVLYEQAINLIPAQLTPGYREQQSTRYVVLPTRRQSVADQALADANTPPVFRDLFWNQYLEVLGWERITVPAGSFDVARISRRIFFKHFDTFRMQSTRTETLWYSPELGYWAARQWTGQYLMPGNRRRGDFFREDWVRWELLHRMDAAMS